MQVTKIWDKYQKGVDHHNTTKMYSDTERFHHFFAGNQWYKAETGGKELPVLNFIKPTGKYKISLVAQNNMAIVFSDMAGDNQELCEMLNDFAAQTWEKSKMDFVSWEVIKNAFIAGDHYVYWHDDRDQYEDSVLTNYKASLKCRMIHKTNVYLGDEQNPNIQEQDYIIISERVPVARVKEIASANGIKDEDIALIASDEETYTQIGESINAEVKTDEGKCTSLLYITKKDGNIAFCRSVKSVIYQPEQVIEGLDLYPLVSFRWESFIGTARGVSGVKQMIPNQVLVNKLEAWRAESVQRTAFAKPVVDTSKIANEDAINRVGAMIKLKNSQANKIDEIISYISPQPMSPDAERLLQEVVSLTREMEGAGDAATGQVDPTRASGEAIKAARDQAAIPLNEQMAAYKQYVEDTALVWYRLWVANSPNGLEVETQAGPAIIPQEVLKALDVQIKIDVTPIDPYSRTAQEMMIRSLFDSDKITIEEYVELLPDTTSMPKNKLKKMLADRVPQGMPQDMPPEMAYGAMGGVPNEML